MITIPNPCFEKWEHMTPNNSGRHCDLCSKTVNDFTSMTNEEIINFLQSKKDESVCVRIQNSQLEDLKKQDIILKIKQSNYSDWYKMAMVLVVCFCLSFGCNTNKMGEISEVSTADTTPKIDTTKPVWMGMPAVERIPKVDSKPSQHSNHEKVKIKEKKKPAIIEEETFKTTGELIQVDTTIKP